MTLTSSNCAPLLLQLFSVTFQCLCLVSFHIYSQPYALDLLNDHALNSAVSLSLKTFHSPIIRLYIQICGLGFKYHYTYTIYSFSRIPPYTLFSALVHQTQPAVLKTALRSLPWWGPVPALAILFLSSWRFAWDLDFAGLVSSVNVQHWRHFSVSWDVLDRGSGLVCLRFMGRCLHIFK